MCMSFGNGKDSKFSKDIPRFFCMYLHTFDWNHWPTLPTNLKVWRMVILLNNLELNTMKTIKSLLRVCCLYIHQLINSKHRELGVFPFHKIKCLEMVQFKDLLIVSELHDMDKITKFPWQALLVIDFRLLNWIKSSMK